MAKYRNTASVHTALKGLKPKYAAFVIEYYKDFSARRAAEASGFAPDTGYQIIDRPEIQEALHVLMMERLEYADITKEWALSEAVDNHYLARQQGNIASSNAALGLVMKHTDVDAFAADKVEVNEKQEILDRLRRGRQRNATSDDEPSFM